MATVVAIITTIVVANATQTITAPNAAFISYNLAAGANSAAITPATTRSALVMGCCTTFANAAPGIGQVSLLSIPNSEILWVGLESYYGATITGGATAQTAGVHIVYVDYSHQLDIQTAGLQGTILVHNGAAGTRAGNVTLVW